MAARGYSLSTTDFHIVVEIPIGSPDGYYKVENYTTVFHTVLVDDRVSVPFHYKRFSMKMFAFIQEAQVLKHEVYVHCDLVICDTTSPAEGICQGQCANRVLKGTPKQTKRERGAWAWK
ncbi:hypothetical protein GOODEAATRI_024959 [Goodea atripinnis]|uniref:ZP domain-containing protein n=1 Tax=Goodea atripinnis TaxID=208336 RepID=A0ABV0NN13_9TELE